LKIAFPNITSVVRPEIYDREIKDPNWVAGFTDAEGCFFIEIAKSSSCKTGHRVLLKFHISQHSRDEQLMRSLEEYFNCGNYQPRSNRDVGNFRVAVFSDPLPPPAPEGVGGGGGLLKRSFRFSISIPL
jgi:hypothetical protein